MLRRAYTSAMANTPKPAYSQVAIRCGGLTVEIGTEAGYPAFKEAMEQCKQNGIDVSNMRLITADYGDDFDDEE